MTLNIDKLRQDFPALHRLHKKKPIIYLDNACMTLKPTHVLDAIQEYYVKFSGCHGRTNHLFGAETTKKYEEARIKIQKFFHAAHPEEIIFTRNSTEGLNLLAYTINFQPGDIVVTSDIEHNSNLLPWQILERKQRIKRIIVPTKKDTSFDIDKYRELITPDVKLVSVLLTSNLSGVSFPIEDITEIAHKNGALVCLDAAQSSLYKPIDVQHFNVDFMVASLHKMWGPSGVGILYGKKALLKKLPQFLSGGETIEDSTYSSMTVSKLPDKFEAGLQNYAGALGAGAAVAYINKIGPKNIYNQIQELNAYASRKTSEIKGIRFLGPASSKLRSSILNLFIDNMNIADISRILNESENIMVRIGKHCVHSWFNGRKLPDSLRISFSAYNTFEEIDVAINSLKDIMKFFR